jgi:protein subunit release factor B
MADSINVSFLLYSLWAEEEGVSVETIAQRYAMAFTIKNSELMAHPIPIAPEEGMSESVAGVEAAEAAS